MISYITPCCRKCLNPNDTLYVKVTNNYIYYVYMIIEYTFNCKLTKKQSSVFKPGKSEHLTFPSGSSTVYLRILDASKQPPLTVWLQYASKFRCTCYNLTGQSISTANCVEVSC